MDQVIKERIISPDVREPAERMWSNCLRIGEFIFVSGMTSRADDGVSIVGANEYEQAEVVFKKIRHLVTSAGGKMDDIVKMTIFVTDISRNGDVWKARRNYFTGDYPACTLVEVSSLATPEILLEIEAIAIRGAGDKSV